MTTVFSTLLGNFLLNEDAGRILGLFPTGDSVRGNSPLTKAVQAQLNEYFRKERKTFQLPYELQGTPFRTAVWNALSEIPYGETRSYGEIAQKIGVPGASRAVGGAIHKNPILILIPCHRVIGADGNLRGFAAGIPLKKTLLTLEGWNET